MDLPSFLIHLYESSYSAFTNTISYLDNYTLKSLRLSIPKLTHPLFPFLFRRIYLSAHDTDLTIFRLIASQPRARSQVIELIWDDTTFDRWISGQQTYTDRFLQITPLNPKKIRESTSILNNAYRFWASEAAEFSENRIEDVDRKVLAEHIGLFPKLRYITIMSRSRLTYVDSRAYWKVWQTPRSRMWKNKEFYDFLIEPEPFKPSIGTTVEASEGIRPMRTLLDMARRMPDQFKIGSLLVNSIGGGQTRLSGSSNRNRYERKWHFDLNELTAKRSSGVGKGKMVVNLLVEMQTEDIFKHPSLWEELFEEAAEAGKDTIEEITISNICFDFFFEHQLKRPHRILENCKVLKRLNLEGGWCQNPAPLLGWLKASTTVNEVMISGVDVESVSWLEVLQDLRRCKVEFDYFEIKASRCSSDFYPIQVDNRWAAPWTGSSDEITAWLRGEQVAFPLSQGPG